jgi:hypothetical protein
LRFFVLFDAEAELAPKRLVSKVGEEVSHHRQKGETKKGCVAEISRETATKNGTHKTGATRHSRNGVIPRIKVVHC